MCATACTEVHPPHPKIAQGLTNTPLFCSKTSLSEQRQAFERAEQRRAAEAAEMAFREDAHKRQAHHLAEVAALNREVGC